MTGLRVLILRIKATIAVKLLKGTALEVARTEQIEQALEAVFHLRQYVLKTGMLPSKMKARSFILSSTANLHERINAIALFPKAPIVRDGSREPPVEAPL